MLFKRSLKNLRALRNHLKVASVAPAHVFYRFQRWAQQAESQDPNFNNELNKEVLTVFLGTELDGGSAERTRWCPSQTALLGTQTLLWLCEGNRHSPGRCVCLPPCNTVSFQKRAKADRPREQMKAAALRKRRNAATG